VICFIHLVFFIFGYALIFDDFYSGQDPSQKMRLVTLVVLRRKSSKKDVWGSRKLLSELSKSIKKELSKSSGNIANLDQDKSKLVPQFGPCFEK